MRATRAVTDSLPLMFILFLIRHSGMIVSTQGAENLIADRFFQVQPLWRCYGVEQLRLDLTKRDPVPLPMGILPQSVTRAVPAAQVEHHVHAIIMHHPLVLSLGIGIHLAGLAPGYCALGSMTQPER